MIHPFWQRCEIHHQELILNFQISRDLITTDQSLLERIVLELLNNACKYTPAHERIIFAVCLPPVHSRLYLTVTNTGVTIPLAEQSRIFTKFHRLPDLDHFNHGGTGLGLALAKKAVELLGGQISLHSASQQTCFNVSLPSLPV